MRRLLKILKVFFYLKEKCGLVWCPTIIRRLRNAIIYYSFDIHYTISVFVCSTTIGISWQLVNVSKSTECVTSVRTFINTGTFERKRKCLFSNWISRNVMIKVYQNSMYYKTQESFYIFISSRERNQFFQNCITLFYIIELFRSIEMKA